MSAPILRERAGAGSGFSPGLAEAPELPSISYGLIELFFFAYRDFVSDPDRLLGELSFGRAHHRVLHFVSRRPGMPVADLLDVLKITKQSLNRVLKELVDKGYVESRPGTADRRQRLLFPTPVGAEFSRRLARLQTRRITDALAGCPETEAAARRFLFAMIDPAERARVRTMIQDASQDR